LEALLTFSKWNTLVAAPLLAVLFSLAGTAAIFGEIQNTPREFAPGVVSTGHEFGITFTLDGKEAYFSRFAAHQPIHIFRTRFVDGQWQMPEKIPLSGDTWSDLDPFISPDGEHLFFISTRPADGRTGSTKNMDIWVADRSGTEWVAPRWIANVNSEGKEGSPSVQRDGTLYFFSDRQGGANKNSLYESKLLNGQYSAPILLPTPINSGTSDTSPFISPDGKALLFYSTRPGGLGEADLYASFFKHGRWTSALNLGPVVNSSGGSEYNPAVSRDGKQFFFGRDGKIYELPIAAIPTLKRARFR
jgi:Tol biopolymer transport system component